MAADKACKAIFEPTPSLEKSKIMTNSANDFSADISMNGRKLEKVTSLKYLGATLCKDGTSHAWQKSASGSPQQRQQWPDQTGSGEAEPSASQASSSCLSLMSPPSSSMTARHGPCLLTLKKGSTLSRPSARGNLSASPTWSTRPMAESGTRSTSLWVHRNLF